MEKNKGIIQGGLVQQEEDKKDLHFGKIYTLPKLEELPDEFTLEPLEILDQLNSDYCAAFAAAQASAFQEEILLSPEYIFQKAKSLTGNYQSWGLDLRTVCKVLKKFGSITYEESPHRLAYDNRDRIANPENWMPSWD